MKQYLLDTNICIYLLKDLYDIAAQIERCGRKNCFISEITLAELYYGASHSGQKEKKMQEEYDFVYLGNLSLGRWKTLIEIGKVLDDLNGKYKLDIFSGCDDQEIINNFKFINSIKFHGYVNSSKVSKIVSKSKVALHVEDITGEYIDRVKYTFSTKIADILNSDTCLMVVAPRDIALTEYCINNDCAYVITDKNNLKDRIIKIMVNDELRNSYVLKADEIVKKNHNAYINGKKLEKYLNDIINKEGVV